MYGRQHANTDVDHLWRRQKSIGTFQPQHLELSSGMALPEARGTEMAKDIQCKNRGLTLDELQFASKLGSGVPAGLRQHNNLKYLKDFKSLSSLSLVELTEIGMEKSQISKSDFTQENELVALWGISDLEHGSPLSSKSLLSGCALHKYNSNHKEFGDSCFTHKEDITIPSTFYNRSCAQNRGDVKHALPYKLEYPWKWKRKPPNGILGCPAKKLKNTFNIYTSSKANEYALASIVGGTKANNKECYIQNVDAVACETPVTMESRFPQQFEKPRPEINTSLQEENLAFSPLTSPKEENILGYSMDSNDSSVYAESKQDEKCTAIKEDFLLQVLMGTRLGFTRCFIFPSDGPLDYLVPFHGMRTNAQRPKPKSSGLSHCDRSITDKTCHAGLQGHLPTLNVIPNNGNHTPEVKLRQEQIPLASVIDVENSYQNKRDISANVLTNFPACHVLQGNHLSLPYIGKKTCLFSLCDRYDESFLSTENTSSARLNYPGLSGKPHFVPDIDFSIFAASLLGTSKNGFSYFERHSLQSASISTTDTFPGTVYKSYKYFVANPGVTLKELEAESSSDAENPIKSFLYANTTNPEYFEKCTPDSDDIKVRLCQTVASFTEKFEKICLPTIFNKEMDENSPKIENYSFSENISISLKRKNTQCNASVKSIDTEHHLKYTRTAHVNDNTTLQEDHTSPTFHLPRDTLNYETEVSVLSGPNTLSGNFQKSPKVLPKNTLIAGSHFHDDILSFDTEHEPRKAEKSNLHQCTEFNVLDIEEHSVSTMFSEVITKNSLGPITSDLRECENILASNPSEQLANGNIELHETSFSIMGSGTNPFETISSIPHSQEIDNKTCSKDHELTSTISKDCTEFEMQSQFSLVLEELRLFHTIGERQNCSKAESEIKDSDHLINASDMRNDDSSTMDVEECNILPKTEYDGEIVAPAREKEVPQRYGSACLAMEETDSTVKEGEISKTSLWIPAFSPYYSTENSMLPEEKERTSCLGIGRVTPLRTRTGPLRIGLSKRAKIKQLHPYLR